MARVSKRRVLKAADRRQQAPGKRQKAADSREEENRDRHAAFSLVLSGFRLLRGGGKSQKSWFLKGIFVF